MGDARACDPGTPRPWVERLANIALALGAMAVVTVVPTVLLFGPHGRFATTAAEGAAWPVRFVRSSPGDADVWFLTVSRRQRSPLDRVFGRDGARVSHAEGVGRPLRGNYQVSDSLRAARSAAGALIDGHTVVIGHGGIAGGFKPGDVVKSIGGVEVSDVARARDLVARWHARIYLGRAAPTQLEVVIERGGRVRTVPVPYMPPMVGELLPLEAGLPAEVPEIAGLAGLELQGPSAGLAFALAYLDAYSGGELAHGRRVAATGELGADGTVNPIGGLREKLAGAEAAHADVVFIPSTNRPDAAGFNSGAQRVYVENLRDAVQWLCAGRHDGVCGTSRAKAQRHRPDWLEDLLAPDLTG